MCMPQRRPPGVRRIVYTSSIAAVGYSDSPDKLRTAADWNEDAQNPYYAAKVQGEREAMRLADATGIDTIRLCPAMVMGPWDYRITPSMGPLALGLISGKGVTWKGGVNLVHAYDGGEGARMRRGPGRTRRTLHRGGENVDMLRGGVNWWKSGPAYHRGIWAQAAARWGWPWAVCWNWRASSPARSRSSRAAPRTNT